MPYVGKRVVHKIRYALKRATDEQFSWNASDRSTVLLRNELSLNRDFRAIHTITIIIIIIMIITITMIIDII